MLAITQIFACFLCLYGHKKIGLTLMKQQTQKIAQVYLLVLYGSGLLALFQEGVPKTVFIWVFLVPALSYFLLGVFWGIIYTVAVMVIASTVFIYQFHGDADIFNSAFLSNIIVCIGINWLLSHEYYAHHEQTQKSLVDIASIDKLTGLYNRALLGHVFYQELKVSRQEELPLSLILLDIDWFKKINDNYGHAEGDKVLRLVAELIRMSVNKKDTIFRLGGEEFCIILPATNLDKALSVAEKLRACIAKEFFEYGSECISISISCGVVACEDYTQTLEEQLKIADNLLYQAKRAGRNQVVSNR